MHRSSSKGNQDVSNNFLHLLDDNSFVAYLISGSDKVIWDDKVANTPGLAQFIAETRQMMNLLQTREKGLTKEDIEKIWLQIRSLEHQSMVAPKRKWANHFFRFAASLLLILGIGAAIWYYNSDWDASGSFQFSPNLALSPSGESTLILPSGNQIELQNDNNPVTVLADGEIIVNNNLISRSETQDGSQSQRMNQVIVPFGRKTELILPDGTQVFLNAGSKIAFPSEFSARQRLVYLEGEAYFNVQHNPSQPFMVNVNELTIKVLGTAFNISGHPSDKTIETVVVEGIVSISDNSRSRLTKNEVEVNASMKASWERGTRNIILASIPNPSLYSAWISGWFIFDRENLYKVLTKMERYYDVNFIYDGQISDANISGKLDLKESVEEVVNALADVADFDFRIDENNVYLKHKLKPLTRK